MGAPITICVLDELGVDRPISRATAKRLLKGVGNSHHAVLDFAGISDAGQAFADEIFRVFANAHPEVELIAIHAVPEVQQMIQRAEVLRDEQGGQLPLPK